MCIRDSRNTGNNPMVLLLLVPSDLLFQLNVSGEYEINETFLPSGWEIKSTNDIILLFSLDGSNLVNEKLFEYSGKLDIQSSIITDWFGSDVDVNVLVNLYHQRLSNTLNQNVLLEAKIETMKRDFEEEKNSLLQDIAELQEKMESAPKPKKPTNNIASR